MKNSQKYLLCESSFDFYDRIAIPAEAILEVQPYSKKNKNQALWQNNPVPVLDASDPNLSLLVLLKSNERILGFPVRKTLGFKAAYSVKSFNDNQFKLLASFDEFDSIPVLDVASVLKPT